MEGNVLPVPDDSVALGKTGGTQALGKVWSHFYRVKELRYEYSCSYTHETDSVTVSKDTVARGNVDINGTTDPVYSARDLYENPTQRHLYGTSPSLSYRDTWHYFNFSYEVTRDQGRKSRTVTVDDFQPWTNRTIDDYRFDYTLTFSTGLGYAKIASPGESADSHAGDVITGTASIFGETLPLYTYLLEGETYSTATTSLTISVDSWVPLNNPPWTDLNKNDDQLWHDGSTL